MGNLFKRGGDNLLNGSIGMALLGVLIASSSIPFLQTIVNFVVDLIPSQYHFSYISYVVFGILGFIAGYIIDRK